MKNHASYDVYFYSLKKTARECETINHNRKQKDKLIHVQGNTNQATNMLISPLYQDVLETVCELHSLLPGQFGPQQHMPMH
jgi:hypothetical protein